MQSKRSLSAITAVLGALALGCVTAPTFENDLEGYDSRSDGFDFELRIDPEPLPVATDKQTLVSIEADRYIAYELEVPEAAEIHMSFSVASQWSVLAEGAWVMGQSLVTDSPSRSYLSRILLFRRTAAPDSASPADKWAFVIDSSMSWMRSDFSYQVLEPGRFMMLVLASPGYYEDGSALIGWGILRNLDEVAPGQVDVQVMTDDGVPAKALRVAIGTAWAMTNDDGIALLDDVAAGKQILKLGPDGLFRLLSLVVEPDEHPSPPDEVWVNGNGERQSTFAIISGEDYRSSP
jgi:hypothetical protein